MDMVGYNKLPPRSWEIHAGYTPDAAIERSSLDLANLLRRPRPVVAGARRQPSLP